MKLSWRFCLTKQVMVFLLMHNNIILVPLGMCHWFDVYNCLPETFFHVVIISLIGVHPTPARTGAWAIN